MSILRLNVVKPNRAAFSIRCIVTNGSANPNAIYSDRRLSACPEILHDGRLAPYSRTD